MAQGKILIVEDDPILSRMYQKRFQTDGFEVSSAYSGDEALTSLDKNAPDLIMLDIMMPKMDGFEFLKRLRQNPNFPKTPVIILTNLGTSPALVEQAKSLGVSDYFVKYKTPAKDIIAKVSQLLGGQNASRTPPKSG